MTLDDIAKRLDQLGRDINLLQRETYRLHRKLPTPQYWYREPPEEFPWVEPFGQLFTGLRDESFASRVTSALHQALAQTEACHRDILNATAKINQLTHSTYSAADLAEWAKSAGKDDSGGSGS